ncbi:uncharacterized, partial [Tachysurus ichikawai]
PVLELLCNGKIQRGKLNTALFCFDNAATRATAAVPSAHNGRLINTIMRFWLALNTQVCSGIDSLKATREEKTKMGACQPESYGTIPVPPARQRLRL